jgi:hypothetical protein
MMLGAALIVLFMSSPASAHSLGAECRVREGRVIVEAYFSDNTAAQESEVTVSNSEKKIVARGQTNESGQWSFPLPPAGHYEVVVEAGMGHRAAVALNIEPKLVAHNSADDSVATVVSEGPSRGEFTATPWFRLALGLGLIVLASAAIRWRLRARNHGFARETGHDKSPGDNE